MTDPKMINFNKDGIEYAFVKISPDAKYFDVFKNGMYYGKITVESMIENIR